MRDVGELMQLEEHITQALDKARQRSATVYLRRQELQEQMNKTQRELVENERELVKLDGEIAALEGLMTRG